MQLNFDSETALLLRLETECSSGFVALQRLETDCSSGLVALRKLETERWTEFVMVLLMKHEMMLIFAMLLLLPNLMLWQKVVPRWVASMELQFAQKPPDSSAQYLASAF